MTRPTTRASFEGAPLYIGIDVHLKRWVVSLCSAGTDLKTFPGRTPSPEELAEHLQRHYLGARMLGACTRPATQGYWT